MQRIPEQAGENGEQQERQSQPETPQHWSAGRLAHAPAFRFDFGLPAWASARAERRLMPLRSSSARMRRCLRSSSTMESGKRGHRDEGHGISGDG